MIAFPGPRIPKARPPKARKRLRAFGGRFVDTVRCSCNNTVPDPPTPRFDGKNHITIT